MEIDWKRLKGQLPPGFPDRTLCFGNMDKAKCNTTLGCGIEKECMLMTIQRQREAKPKRVKSQVRTLQ